MGRILALDYGRKRTGVAVTDTLQISANGLETVQTHVLFDFLKAYFAKESVEKVLVGYPVQMNNQPSESVVFVNGFIKKFKQIYPTVELELVDERFTSKMAFRAMIDGGATKKQRQDKSLVDKISAVIILQSYLEQKNTGFKF